MPNFICCNPVNDRVLLSDHCGNNAISYLLCYLCIVMGVTFVLSWVLNCNELKVAVHSVMYGLGRVIEWLSHWLLFYRLYIRGKKEFGKNITTKYHSGWAFVYIYPIYGSWRHSHPLGWRLGWFPIVFVATPLRHCAKENTYSLLNSMNTNIWN